VFFNLLGLYRTYRYNIWCLHSSQSKDFSTVNPSPALHQPIVCTLALMSNLPLTSVGQYPVSWALGTKCLLAVKYNDKTEELCSKAYCDTHLRASQPHPDGDTRANSGRSVHGILCEATNSELSPVPMSSRASDTCLWQRDGIPQLNSEYSLVSLLMQREDS